MKFNMDQYSDVSRVTKPVIYISVGEIVEMHKVGWTVQEINRNNLF